MEWISNLLFAIANSLLIPDIILLILFFGWSLIWIGRFYGEYTTRRQRLRGLGERLDQIGKGEADIEAFEAALPAKDVTHVVPYYREVLRSGGEFARAEFIIANYEDEVSQQLIVSRLFAKIGPILGLLGTLISMSPALTGLANGDVAGMAYNMQVVFATTVVGLVISAIGLVTLLYRQRWYAHDADNLLYLSRILQERSDDETE